MLGYSMLWWQMYQLLLRQSIANSKFWVKSSRTQKSGAALLKSDMDAIKNTYIMTNVK